MKAQLKARLRVVLLVALTSFVAAPASASTPSAGDGATLVTINGQVFITAPGASEAPGKANTALVPGTRVRTAEKATAELRFPDGSTFIVQSGSAMAISAHKRSAKKTSVMLFFGRLWSKVTKSGGETSYEVKTPNAVCGVRGTEFETGVADDGSVRVRVTEGKVAVDDTSDAKAAEEVDPGEEVAADEDGVDAAGEAEEKAKWEQWQKDRQKRLKKDSRLVVDKTKDKIMNRKAKLEQLRGQQKDLEAKRKAAEEKVRGGDRAALDQVRKYNAELATLADQIADLGDEADSQFGFVDHLADLASDPRMKGIDRKYLEMEAASLRRVKADLDALVKEGTDLSMESMDKLMEDMSKGKGTMKQKGGSAADDLFGGEKLR